MKQIFTRALLLLIMTSSVIWADTGITLPAAKVDKKLPHSRYLVKVKPAPTKTTVPKPPALSAKSYILIDALSGRVIAEKNPDMRLPPASLTKLMSMYIVSDAIQSERIHLIDKVKVSHKAWATGGSKMFVREGASVPVKDLIEGAIVASGNDATIALAEYLSGSEASFVDQMNETAEILGMRNTHFIDSTGLPSKNHYSTARDMSILSRATILNFPEEYKIYREKWFNWGHIRQPNRNRLLWRDKTVDGIKTGHTDEAGYCLTASAKKNGMRLIAVVMGTRSDEARFTQAQQLLHYGFRYYSTHHLFPSSKEITLQRVWKGKNKSTAYGLEEDLFVTIPRGNYHRLTAKVVLNNPIIAPVQSGQVNGHLEVSYDDKIIANPPLTALKTNPEGGSWRKFSDTVTLTVKTMMNKKTT